MVGTVSPAAPDVPVWRKRPRCVFHWRDWGGDSVVFEVVSGHTYQFSPFGAAVMGCFEERDCSFGALARQIGADLHVAADDVELGQALAASVQQFLQLGWIEPIAPA